MSEAVVRAYGARAAEYAALLGRMDAVATADRVLVSDWAQTLTGRVLDVGCGPGHWTGFLAEHGVDIAGVDPTAEFIELAREKHPNVGFQTGPAERLEVADGALGGILAWYSLIHSTRAGVAVALAEFARALRPGGGLLIGFFEGDTFEAFDHAVTTAYRWPIDELSEMLREAGSRRTHELTLVRAHTVQSSRAKLRPFNAGTDFSLVSAVRGRHRLRRRRKIRTECHVRAARRNNIGECKM